MKYLYGIILILITGSAPAQPVFGTCPLDSGNVWVYDYFIGNYPFSHILDSTIIFDDTLHYSIIHNNFNGQIYDVFVRLRDDNYYVQRMPDSYNAPNHERIYYKIGAKTGDSWMQPDPGGITDSLVTDVVDTVRTWVFNKLVTLRLFHIHYSLIDYYETWSDDFGLMSVEDYMGTVNYLYCCIINGVAYGDTTVLAVDDLPESPEEFVLEQNYPNPFNPSTTIQYRTSNQGKVILKVYDLTGREVADLLNENQDAGRHSVVFNTSTLASGVYVYKLFTQDYSAAKKMLLLK